MDLITKGMDLTRALADITVHGNSTVQVGTKLLRWIDRSGIDETEFNYCASLMKNKAFPNDSGLELRAKVLGTAPLMKKAGGLRTHMTTCVGQMMAASEEYCYIVTTVAAIMAYHELPFVVQCLCNIAVDNNGKRDLNHRHGPEYPYDIRRTRVRPVVEKIVESIAQNVGNRGLGLPSFPDELLEYVTCCHVVEADTLSATISAVQSASSMERTLVWMDVFYADIVLWILNHFQGSIEVSIPGKKLIVSSPPKSISRITILVRDKCEPADPTHEYGLEPFIRVSTGDGTKKKVLLNVEAHEVRGQYAPITRRALYDISFLAKPTEPGFWSQGILQPDELQSIQSTAQKIAEWMLELQLEPIPLWNDLPGKACLKYRGFRAALQQESGTFSVKTVLSRWPDLLRRRYGKINQKNLVIFKPPEIPEGIDIVDYNETLNIGFTSADYDQIVKVIQLFPGIVTLLDNIRERCLNSGCPDCGNSVSYGACRPGCLTEMALNGLFTLIGHVIAEGFGVQDASGMVNPKDMKWGVAKLLYQLTIGEFILWDTWFAIASVVYLGCPWSSIKFDKATAGPMSGASCISAVQYGSMIMVAQWTELEAEVSIQRCFGAILASGYQLDGVRSDFGVVLAEETGVYNNTDELPGQKDPFDMDEDEITIETHIIGTTGVLYRLLTIVRSKDYLRNIDPSATLWNLSNSKLPNCPHQREEEAPKWVLSPSCDVHVWGFADLLKGWSPSWPQDGSLYITRMLETHEKANAALSLVPGFAVVISSRCCIYCAIAAAKSSNAPGISSRWKPIISKGNAPSGLLVSRV